MKYETLLPLRTDIRVVDQFGWLPMSVLEPTRKQKSQWKNAYFDDDFEESRRSKPGPGATFSEFHAGLAENLVLYWSMEGSTVVDPFSGRLTRAYVTSKLNRKYYGYEVSPITVGRINAHLKKFGVDNATIYNADGCLMEYTPDSSADLVLTCPPYHDIEKYESVPNQLSDIPDYNTFMQQIEVCAKNIYRVLKPGGFCVWVCADWRAGSRLVPFHVDCVRMFGELFEVHDIIVIRNFSQYGALLLEAVAAKRYTSKIHEYALVFRKAGTLEVTTDIIRTSVGDRFFE